MHIVERVLLLLSKMFVLIKTTETAYLVIFQFHPCCILLQLILLESEHETTNQVPV